MSRKLLMFSIAGMVLLTSSVSVEALMIYVPVSQRVATADSILVGKVVRFEKNTVKAEGYPGAKNQIEYRIAVVKVTNPMKGVNKELTQVRVAIIPPPPPPPPGRPGLPFRPGFRGVRLKEGQQYLLFLNRHHKETFYAPPGPMMAMMMNDNAASKKQLDEVKKYVGLLSEPMKHLQAKSNKQRFETATLLIYSYRARRYPNAKELPIGAKESQLILEALRDADWSTQIRRPFPGQMMPQNVFMMLGLTKKDGWENVPYKQIPAAAKEWLKENAKTYRIKKFVRPQT